MVEPGKGQKFLGLRRDYAGLKQVGQIGRVGCVTQIWRRAGCCFNVEDFLHRTQIGGMGIVDRAGVGKAVLVLMSKWRDDDLTDRVVEVVRVVAGLAVGFAFVPLEDDHVSVLVSSRRHNERHETAQAIISRLDLGRIACQTCETPG